MGKPRNQMSLIGLHFDRMAALWNVDRVCHTSPVGECLDKRSRWHGLHPVAQRPTAKTAQHDQSKVAAIGSNRSAQAKRYRPTIGAPPRARCRPRCASRKPRTSASSGPASWRRRPRQGLRSRCDRDRAGPTRRTQGNRTRKPCGDRPTALLAPPWPANSKASRAQGRPGALPRAPVVDRARSDDRETSLDGYAHASLPIPKRA